ncbi:hypothetical protein GQ53DRAFT_547406 [Thozetella sp. PMI_491]|nr:hypothetical protein GQ53DRAFT_547406 [Thozetella sp. PMI_491]
MTRVSWVGGCMDGEGGPHWHLVLRVRGFGDRPNSLLPSTSQIRKSRFNIFGVVLKPHIWVPDSRGGNRTLRGDGHRSPQRLGRGPNRRESLPIATHPDRKWLVVERSQRSRRLHIAFREIIFGLGLWPPCSWLEAGLDKFERSSARTQEAQTTKPRSKSSLSKLAERSAGHAQMAKGDVEGCIAHEQQRWNHLSASGKSHDGFRYADNLR